MSFICEKHGWQHLFAACPVCFDVATFVSADSTSKSGMEVAADWAFKDTAKITALEMERDALQTKLAEAMRILEKHHLEDEI